MPPALAAFPYKPVNWLTRQPLFPFSFRCFQFHFPDHRLLAPLKSMIESTSFNDNVHVLA